MLGRRALQDGFGDDSGIQSLSPYPHGLPYQQNESQIRWPFSTHNQLKYIEKKARARSSYILIYSGFSKHEKRGCIFLKVKVRPAGLEPATPCLEGRCSIRLSYGRKQGKI
jgi:hypothetical protein